MRHLRMLGLAVVAAAVLMSLVGVGSASATVLCKTNMTSGCAAGGWDYPAGTAVEMTLDGSFEKTAGGFIEDTCTGSTMKVTRATTGSATTTVSGNATSLTWSNCTFPTTTTKLGSLEIHWISGTDNGTLTASRFEVTLQTLFGNCVYQTGSNNDLGAVVGGNPAHIAITASVIGGGAFGCPTTETWTASYTFTAPKPLFISES